MGHPLKTKYAKQGKPSDTPRQSEDNKASTADGEEKDEEVGVVLRMPDEAVSPVLNCSGSVSISRLPPKPSDIPRQTEDNRASTADGEEPDSIFSVLGRSVHQFPRVDEDVMYAGASVMNANQAERRSIEMVDAISWINSPEAAATDAIETDATEFKTSDKVPELLTVLKQNQAKKMGDTNISVDIETDADGWENEDKSFSVGITDDVSVFSNATEFETSDNVPDLTTMLKQNMPIRWARLLHGRKIHML